MNRISIVFCKIAYYTIFTLTLIVGQSNIAIGEKEGLDFLQDITNAVVPVENGDLSRMILTGDRLVYGICGRGQAVYDGWIRESILSKPSKTRIIIELGPNSLSAKDLGPYSESPRFVASPTPDLYVINLICASDFPLPDSESKSNGTSGNVVVYDAKLKRFKNLTKLDAGSGRYFEGLKWFEDEEVLLMEESKIEAGSSYFPIEGTGKPICFKLLEERTVPIEKFPRIMEWYDLKTSIEIKTEVSSVMGQAPLTLKITRKGGDQMIRFILQNREEWYREFVINSDTLCISSPSFGTFLADFSGRLMARLSTEYAIDYNAEGQKLFLRSLTADDNGEYRYSILDIKMYFGYILRKLAAKR